MLSSFYDSVNLFSKLNVSKMRNAWDIHRSFRRSLKSHQALIKGLPISISFEPTTSCNLRCPECPSGLRSFTRPTGMLSDDLFKQVIDELANTLLYLTFYFQGEPYLHPQFLDLVKYASDRRVYTATSTNAHYLNDKQAEKTVQSGLDRLIISIDGTTQETYQSYRIGGNLEKVIAGTERLLAWRKKLHSKTPQVIFQFLVVKPNQHQIEEVKVLAKKIGVDKVVFKTAQIYDYENGSDLIPTLDEYSRYKKQEDGKYLIKNNLLNHCWRMWHSCVITWDGKVVPCCFDKDATHQLGDLSKHSFSSVWNSQPYNDFRQILLEGRDQIEICKNCTEGTKVWT